MGRRPHSLIPHRATAIFITATDGEKWSKIHTSLRTKYWKEQVCDIAWKIANTTFLAWAACSVLLLRQRETLIFRLKSVLPITPRPRARSLLDEVWSDWAKGSPICCRGITWELNLTPLVLLCLGWCAENEQPPNVLGPKLLFPMGCVKLSK